MSLLTNRRCTHMIYIFFWMMGLLYMQISRLRGLLSFKTENAALENQSSMCMVDCSQLLNDNQQALFDGIIRKQNNSLHNGKRDGDPS